MNRRLKLNTLTTCTPQNFTLCINMVDCSLHGRYRPQLFPSVFCFKISSLACKTVSAYILAPYAIRLSFQSKPYDTLNFFNSKAVSCMAPCVFINDTYDEYTATTFSLLEFSRSIRSLHALSYLIVWNQLQASREELRNVYYEKLNLISIQMFKPTGKRSIYLISIKLLHESSVSTS